MDKIVIVRVQLVLIVILFISALAIIFSQNANPDNEYLYGLKRIQEKVYLKMESNPEGKFDYMRALLNKRLKEIANMLKNKSHSHILQSSLRYSALAGEITDLAIANNFDKDATKAQFEDHKKVLYDLYVEYPKNTEDTEYKYIEDDINYLDLYLEKLK